MDLTDRESTPRPHADVLAALDVLVVDDDPSHLEATRELLGRWGITPVMATDGVQAVAVAGDRKLDLILMDLQMPKLDGLGATKQIRLLERERCRPRVPVVAYTACLLEEALLRHCGVDGVLQKPCSAEDLQECMLRWCARASRVGLESRTA